MNALRLLVFLVDIFLVGCLVEVVLDFIKPGRVMRTDFMEEKEARRSLLYARIALALLTIFICVLLWASWKFALSGWFR